MRLKYNFTIREIMGEYLVVPLGDGALQFSGMISTNEIGAMLIESLKQDVKREELLEKILTEYDVDEQTAVADLDEFLDRMSKLDLLIVE